MEVILLIYGFSFLALGLVIVVCLRKNGRGELTSPFRWLAAFAFVHGALEWMELWRAIGGDSPTFSVIRSFVLLVSYLLLFESGRRLLRTARSRERPAVGEKFLLDVRIYILLIGGVAAGSIFADNFPLNLVALSRYLVGTAASTLVGVGFLHMSRRDLRDQYPAYILRAYRLAGISFLLYGIFGGLIVPRTGWLPAAWPNEESFAATFHAPVQLFRTICAVSVTLFLGGAVFWNAKLKEKVWLLTSAIIALIMTVDLIAGYNSIENTIREELKREAKDVRAILMATRRVYHLQFLASGLPINEQTIGFLPAHALSRISKDFRYWSQSGLSFNNVSDRPRNPANLADGFELDAIAFFRANPMADERLVEIQDAGGKRFYHYTAPIRIEAYCLQCHGAREEAPPSIAKNYDAAYGYQLGDLRGVMSIKLPVTSLRNGAYMAWLTQFSVRLAGYTLLATILALFLNRVVVSRLIDLRQATARLAGGDYATRSSATGNDEVGELSQAFNQMSEAIQERDGEIRRLSAERLQAIDELQRHKENLEHIVAERTAALNQHAKELEIANADLDSFSYSVSHDLRAPLRAINGFASILREEYAPLLGEEGMRMFQSVANNAVRMGQLIDDVLAFSRIGRRELQKVPLDMMALAREAWQELEPQWTARAIEFRLLDLPGAYGDPSAVRQVLQNLFGNAIKFTQRKESAVIEVGGREEGAANIYYVRDNGIGFDGAHAQKLFGLFERLHGVGEYEGTGIGLTIVKRYIDKLGGQVRAEGRLGEGATIWFTLPGRR